MLARFGLVFVLSVGTLCVVGRGISAEETSFKARPSETVGDLLERRGQNETAGGSGGASLGSFARLLTAVGGVVVLALLGVWFFRRSPLGANARRGSELIEVVGRTAISSRHSVCLLRVGPRRIVIVGVCGDEMTALANVDDPQEVDALLDSVAASEASSADGAVPASSTARWGLLEILSAWKRRTSSAGSGGDR